MSEKTVWGAKIAVLKTFFLSLSSLLLDAMLWLVNTSTEGKHMTKINNG